MAMNGSVVGHGRRHIHVAKHTDACILAANRAEHTLSYSRDEKDFGTFAG